MVMKYSWFHHHECTTEQADELVACYRRRGVTVERSLNRDNITWTISVQLPEGEKAPRSSKVWQNRAWG
ncbi:hypothetical protein [Citrobacter freundii]|uniref:hypothetical protein n=1 Tax=Citrobacter freundii TaxID=546 RepID=UPI0023B111F0|nr:hypothetical protein [Citrobacter freundii]